MLAALSLELEQRHTSVHHSLRALKKKCKRVSSKQRSTCKWTMEKSKRLNSQKRKRAQDWMVRSRFGPCPTCTVYVYIYGCHTREANRERERRAYYLGTAFRILTACILHTRTWARERDYMGFFYIYIILETYCILQGTASIGYSLLHRPVLVTCRPLKCTNNGVR
jgi:hypothetical protein